MAAEDNGSVPAANELEEETASAPTKPKAVHPSVSLCLSGGGFRAALFELGVLRRLNELRLLGRVRLISSVSGGSILAAHLARAVTPWPPAGQSVSDWPRSVEQPFLDFVSRDRRTAALLRRLLPHNWFCSDASAEAMVRVYEAQLTPMRLVELPQRPRFVINATDMAFGVNFVFCRTELGSYMAGFMRPPPDFPVARAVAASSCFPPLFGPLTLHGLCTQLKSGSASVEDRRRLLPSLSLTDGGVYDNLALEPAWKDPSAVVIVLDGGSPFSATWSGNPFWQWRRYVDLMGRQNSAQRRRRFIAGIARKERAGAYVGISGSPASYGGGLGYGTAFAEARIARIRTDLNAFSPGECAVLLNHGYYLIDAALRRRLPELLPRRLPPLTAPAEDLLDEEAALWALAPRQRRVRVARTSAGDHPQA